MTNRQASFSPQHTALLVIDVQNSVWNEHLAENEPYFFHRVNDTVLPNLKRLLADFRQAGAEVMYTVMENLTADGRDRSLDYKLSGIFIPKGSWEARVVAGVHPGEDDICLPKTSSGVFNSTNLDYLLRNLGVRTLVLAGFLTDQCVDHAVRDGADRGFNPICISDACATYSEERHQWALRAFSGYCRTFTTDEYRAHIAESSSS